MLKRGLILSTTCCLLFFVACKSDDDGGPSESQGILSISDVSKVEGDEENKMVFTVNMLGGGNGELTIKYRTEDGTAVAGDDYRSDSGTLTFVTSNSNQNIEIDILGDDVVEFDETFELVLFDITNGTFSRDKAIGKIENDDIDGDNPFGMPLTGYTSPTEYSGLEMIWSDEFDGDAIDEEIWNFEIGTGDNGWGNNELQYYRKENSLVHNGHLMIEARQENFGGRNYTSTRMTTQSKYTVQYGRIDIRAALPQGKGLWPALWMLGANFPQVGWPSCGEIDIMEMVGGAGNTESTTHGTVHWDSNGSYASFGGSHTISSGKLADEFHVYSIIWDATAIRWYIDDIEYHVIEITDASLSEFQQDFFFIFNVAVGGNWPGSPDGTAIFPQRMFVDYVRVFQ